MDYKYISALNVHKFSSEHLGQDVFFNQCIYIRSWKIHN